MVFIGLGRKPEFYESIIKEEFNASKNIELRAVGRAIPRALKIAEKLNSFSTSLNNVGTAEYTRLISQPITLEGKENILIIIKLKLTDKNEDRSR